MVALGEGAPGWDDEDEADQPMGPAYRPLGVGCVDVVVCVLAAVALALGLALTIKD